MGNAWGWGVHGTLLADRYSLTEPLGSGGMAQVWRAWDTSLSRNVAVKLLTAPAADPSAGQYFMDEAQATARLTHAGIAALYDFGHATDGRPFLVMELVEGHSLAEILLTEGQLASDRVADLGAQVARALAAAHAAGVLHRDVKPANLLVTDDGTVKVVDFGIAQVTDHIPLPDGAPVLGTAAYTAPELALHHPAGPASDLYGLGCALYELLTGQPPFTGGDAAQVLYRHVHEQPARLTDIRPDASPELLRAVEALLAKNPADRPQSAAEAARRLQAPLLQATADQEGTQILPPVGDVTAPLPPIADGAVQDGAPGEPRASRRRVQRAPRVPLPLLVGGLVAVGALLLTGFFLLLGGGDVGGSATVASQESRAASTADTSEPDGEASSSSAQPSPAASTPTAAASATPSATPSATGSATPSRTPSPTVKQAVAQDPATLSRQLIGALAGQSGNMAQDVYNNAQKQAAQIDQKIQQSSTAQAADKAQALDKFLSDAQKKGKWGGNTQIMQLLAQLAALG
ncbi:serine/threonine-protein kinase [Streptomyces sp. NPDC004393]|uniref:serine/threonine-protein kinase n=1 Tax=Streptomyces sp. NPDC004533 TaxID=3154278 RepID=UPI0033B7A118